MHGMDRKGPLQDQRMFGRWNGRTVNGSSSRWICKGLWAALDGILVVLLFLLIVGASAKPAYAYADPGTGLLLVQIVTTSLAGTLFIVRKWIRNLFHQIVGLTPAAEESGNKSQIR